ncbi:UNVERIFIED_CONTAM: Plastidic ATP/ADP-transporter [Sesamum angustifolium]|uniref:ADP,ATP carrier protein n=1 Tax=Sesamum angustifolium TaxID=2727405 RepID=A0AAW2RJK9_9LAMI
MQGVLQSKGLLSLPSNPRTRAFLAQPSCDLRAEAAAASADGQPVYGEKESPKFMGMELVTFKKIIPLGMMFFCILFNYTILRDTKDVLVVTAKGSSAEIIPFLKTWVNLPMAVGFMLLYTKLANVLSKEALFYSVILPFIAFFGAFGFVLYPLSHYSTPQLLLISF